MPSCCVINCNNCSQNTRLFRLPTGDKNKDRRSIWLRNIARKNWQPDVAYICEVHFTPDQFEQKRADGRKLLKWNAVPTLFPSRVPKKMKSRFLKKGKIPKDEIDSADPFTSEVSGHPIKEESYTQEAITLILPQTVTAPLNSSGDDIKLGDDKIIFIKFEPNKDDNETLRCDEVTDKMLKEDILYLKRKLRGVKLKTKNIENIKSQFKESLKLIYSPDQIQFLESRREEGVTWSDETVSKALRLYKQCGDEGYREIIEQKLPFPSLDTLQKLHPDVINSNTVPPEMMEL